MQRGEIWWATLPTPIDSEPGYRRPIVIVQADAFNRSRIGTVIALAVTSNIQIVGAPGNVLLPRKASKLRRRSVVNVSQVLTLDRTFLGERVSSLPRSKMEEIDRGLRLALDL